MSSCPWSTRRHILPLLTLVLITALLLCLRSLRDAAKRKKGAAAPAAVPAQESADSRCPKPFTEEGDQAGAVHRVTNAL